MTLGEVLTVLGAAVGGGGLTKIAEKWLSARKAQTNAEADIVKRALDLVDEEREDTQRHVTSLVDCERRCARIEAAHREVIKVVAQLSADLEAEKAARDALHLEVANLRQEVQLRREQSERLYAELDDVYRSIGKVRPSTQPPACDDPNSPEVKLRIIEEVSDEVKKAGKRR